MWSNFEDKTVLLELPDATTSELGNVQTLQNYIEDKTSITTVIKGVGYLGSAVAELMPPILGGSHVKGIVRLSQLTEGLCFVDGVIDGFDYAKQAQGNRRYCLAIHEYGDLAGDNYDSIGPIMVNLEPSFDACDPTVTRIRKQVPNCDVSAMIGRSIAVTEVIKEKMSGQVLSAGVIARASIIDANKKRICSCSGKTIWEERLDRKQRDLG